jgi:HD-like signal output (HDOD) protein
MVTVHEDHTTRAVRLLHGVMPSHATNVATRSALPMLTWRCAIYCAAGFATVAAAAAATASAAIATALLLLLLLLLLLHNKLGAKNKRITGTKRARPNQPPPHRPTKKRK